MNKILWTVVLIFLTFTSALATKAASPDAAIRAVYRQYDQTVKQNSPQALLTFFQSRLAPDYQHVDTHGRVKTRAQILEDLQRQVQTGSRPGPS